MDFIFHLIGFGFSVLFQVLIALFGKMPCYLLSKLMRRPIKLSADSYFAVGLLTIAIFTAIVVYAI
jgi:hypothetical protein